MKRVPRISLEQAAAMVKTGDTILVGGFGMTGTPVHLLHALAETGVRELVYVANNVGELHSRTGDANLFVDERGRRINGQWTGSPSPVEHDILTGSNPDGTLARGLTCADWTSASPTVSAQVGHSDGMGPGQSTAGTLSSWNSAHANQDCSNTAPRGGAGRFYCFAR